MARRYAKGKRAVGICARSGRKMLLEDMVSDGYLPNLIVDPAWREPDHPQDHPPVMDDPVALYRPAPEPSADGGPEGPVIIVHPVYNVLSNQLLLMRYGFGVNGVSVLTEQNQVTYIDSLCFATTIGANPYVFSVPAGAQPGDLMILAFMFTSATLTMSLPSGWNPLSQWRASTTNYDDDLASSGGHTMQLAYRVMQLGDSSFSMTVGSTVNAAIGGCVHAFRFVDTDHPVPQILVTSARGPSDTDVTHGAEVAHSPAMNPLSSGGKMMTFLKLNNLNANPILTSPAYSPGTPDYSFNQSYSVSSSTRVLAQALWSPGSAELSNMFPYSYRNFQSWTAVNTVVTDLASGESTADMVPVANAGRHEITQTVTLTSGQVYTFITFATRRHILATDHYYMSVINPSAVEVGNTFDKEGDAFMKISGSIGGGFTNVTFRRALQPGTTLMACVVATYTATATGVHTFCIGHSTTAGVASSDYTAFGGNKGGLLYAAVLMNGDSCIDWAGFGLESTGVALSNIAGIRQRVLRGIDTTGFIAQMGYSIELKRADATPDRIRLMCTEFVGQRLSTDRLSILNALEVQNGTTDVRMIATGTVDPWQNSGPRKFYFEVEMEAPWGAGADRTYVGVTLPFAHHGRVADSTSEPTDGAFYGYGNGGNIRQDGVTTATVGTYQNGDFIGCMIDFTTNQITFYKNGSLVATTTLVSQHQGCPLRAVIHQTSQTTNRPLTVNFSGPFAFGKPAGSIAYDWEYEP